MNDPNLNRSKPQLEQPVAFLGDPHRYRPDCSYGRGRSITALTTLKIAVLAPIPSATVSTTAKQT